MEKYRFDDAYGAVYEYSEESHAYIFCGKYGVFDITPDMSEEEKSRNVYECLSIQY